MFYFDTSFLAPLVVEESTSERIEQFIWKLPTRQLATSHWTRVEFASLLAREVRMGGFDRETAQEIDVEFESIMAESFIILAPNIHGFDLAKEFLGTYESGLRGGDALHLAVAKNHRAEVMYTLDKSLLKAGKLLNVTVRTGIALPTMRT